MVGAEPFTARREPIMAKRNELVKETALNNQVTELSRSEAPSELLRELVAHLRQNRTQLREEWVVRITETRLLTAMTKEEIFAEATSVYDSYVEALETETFEALQAYARNLSERIIPRGVETHEVVGIVLLLCDVLARSLFAKYQNDFKKLNRILDAYEAAMDGKVANHLVQTVEASRLLGATVIVTGLSPEIAQTLVTIGVDLGKMNTVGDLQGGIEQAERLLGYKVETLAEPR